MHVLLVTHSDIASDPTRCDHELVARLGDRVRLAIADWAQVASPTVEAVAEAARTDLASVDACICYVRFRYRHEGPAFDWSGFTGLRVWMEHDAWLNFGARRSKWHGAFPDVFRRDGYHLMVTTGRRTTELLRGEGVNAAWMPKGYTETRFADLGGRREGVCTFGRRWASRRAMIHHLRRHGVALADVSGPFETLNDRLNRHASAVICNMVGEIPFSRAGRALNRVWPAFVRLSPAVEPMIKTFEIAAAGCAPVVDHLDELAELGFIDGETCLTYRSFEEAVSKLQSVSDEELHAIGKAAGQLASSRHTWGHRADQLADLLARHL